MDDDDFGGEAVFGRRVVWWGWEGGVWRVSGEVEVDVEGMLCCAVRSTPGPVQFYYSDCHDADGSGWLMFVLQRNFKGLIEGGVAGEYGAQSELPLACFSNLFPFLDRFVGVRKGCIPLPRAFTFLHATMRFKPRQRLSGVFFLLGTWRFQMRLQGGYFLHNKCSFHCFESGQPFLKALKVQGASKHTHTSKTNEGTI